MSGGVDSSVSAALLKEQGYDVVGVYMKNWSQDLPGFHCPWEEDYKDAKRVATDLGIDFKVYDFEKEYRDKVVDYMIREYEAGNTPNPDIMCNQEVKFKLFLNTALSEGADLIATGHYSRQINGKLFAGIDNNKDQSYFLCRVDKSALNKVIFPVGGYTKPEIRKLAKKFGLSTADKKDSQGICFVGQIGIKEFLSQFVKTKPGNIINQKGEIIGQHDGAIFYTIGQRQGLGVGGGLPYYVVGKDMDKNEVYVTTDLQDDRLWLRKFRLTQFHKLDKIPSELMIRTRYRAPLVKVKTFQEDKNGFTVELKDDIRAITPGQSAVLYSKDQVIGSGIVV